MSRKTTKLVITAIISSAIFNTQVMASETLRLEDALAIAYRDSPRMAEARGNLRSSKGEATSASKLPDMEVEFEIGGLKGVEGEEKSANLDIFKLEQQFDPPGVREVRSESARKVVSSREESLKAVWASVYAETRNVFMRIILDKKEADLAYENLDTMRQFYNRVQDRYQAARAIKNDLQRAKIELLKAENALLASEQHLKSSKARLNLCLGRSLATEFDIAEELKEDSVALDYGRLAIEARTRSPLVRSAEFELAARSKDTIREELNRLPSPYVGFQSIDTDYDNDYEVIIGATMPIWDMNQGAVVKARGERDAQSARLRSVKQEVEFNLFDSYLKADLAKRQLELLKQSLEEANELLHLAHLRYGEGELDFLKYLDEVKAVNETRVRYYEGLYNLSRALTDLESVIYGSVRKEGYLK